MKLISRDERQLLVMAALAAANHGLSAQAEQILEAFHWLIPDKALRCTCQALVLLGLEQPVAALECLTGQNIPEALTVRQIILACHPTAAAEIDGSCLKHASITP